MPKFPGRNSLKGQLVRRFALVLAAMMAVVTIGFFLFLLIALPSTNSADLSVQPAIGAALRTEGGNLRMEITRDLRATTEVSPGFWFVAAHPEAGQVRYGPIPREFEYLLPQLQAIRSLDVRAGADSPLTAALAEIDSPAGRLHVLYGGRSAPGPYVLNLLWGLKIIYIPFTLAPLVVVMLVLPRMVGRALAGMDTTIDRASAIGANSLGVRLPKDDVVVELHPLVGAINAALSRIDDEVSQRQRFFANAAHELRTPIAILQTRLETLPPGTHRDQFLVDVGRLAAMAEQFLDMQRFGSVQSWSDVELVSLCESVAADWAPMAIAAGYELEFETEVESCLLQGDRASLERAVTNLVRNAIDHGGGKGKIQIKILREGAVDVTDEGPGIPPGEREKVFEAFYRTRPKATGAGLGLSLVHQIAEAHGGNVDIIDQKNGARFRLRLVPSPGA